MADIRNDGAPDFKIDAARDYVPVVKSADPLPNGMCRGLLVATAGTVNLTTMGGAERDGVPLVAGYNMLVCTHVRPGGTATNAFAIY